MTFHAQPLARQLHARRHGRRASSSPTACRAQPGAPFADPCVTDARHGHRHAAPLQGGRHPARREAQQGGLALPAGAHHRAVGRRRGHAPRHSARPSRSSSAPTPATASPSSTPTWSRTYYELDDFQVRTPTDIIGQHIHLVKFDVTSSDGAGNGFNYEDGTFAPERGASSASTPSASSNGCVGKDTGDPRDGTFTCPVARPHPYARHARRADHRPALVRRPGARTTPATTARCAPSSRTTTSAPRRTSRPASTPASSSSRTGSNWRAHRDRRVSACGSRRSDGGPTTWRADILTADRAEELPRVPARVRRLPARLRGGRRHRRHRQAHPRPGARHQPAGARRKSACPSSSRRPTSARAASRSPCPEAISAADPGTMSVNYRNEPLALRVRNPGDQHAGGRRAGRPLARLPLASRRAPTRASTRSPSFYPPLTSGRAGRATRSRRCCAPTRTTACRSASSSARTRRGTTSASTASSGCSSRRDAATPATATAR